MGLNNRLQIGDVSNNGQVEIVDEDRLCYLVRSTSRGASGLRTISKSLLKEYVNYWEEHPDATAESARQALSGTSEIDKFEYGYSSTLSVMAQMVLQSTHKVNNKVSCLPHQQIFYGAPGTGKSFGIKRALVNNNVVEDNIFRTTFHPDSDYSTFVGAYKPTMEQVEKELNKDALIEKLNKLKASKEGYPVHKFAAKYWRSLKKLSNDDINDIIEKCGFTKSFLVEVNKAIAVGESLSSHQSDLSIVYRFIPQAFLNAYVRAYQTDKNVYLIIEEINRGNCAQIFGDLFQLLDRGDNGKSDYSIKADTDIRTYLETALGSESEGIKNGELCLPSNLHIWATMNTSDQSLFPIDSAFKRRWEWEYVPIRNEEKGWVIAADDTEWDWWEFLKAVNEKIGSITDSEDKKLGYFFVKPADGHTITAKTFVGKVLFYLWNDVFKDYGFSDDEFQTEEGKEMKYPMFYETEGGKDVNERLIARFLSNLKLKTVDAANVTAEEITAEDNEA